MNREQRTHRNALIVERRRLGDSIGLLAQDFELTRTAIEGVLAKNAPELVRKQANRIRDGFAPLPQDFGPRLRVALRAAGKSITNCARAMKTGRSYLSAQLLNGFAPFPPHHISALRDLLKEPGLRYCMGETDDLPISGAGEPSTGRLAPLPRKFGVELRQLLYARGMGRGEIIIRLGMAAALTPRSAESVIHGQQSLGRVHLPALRQAFGDEIIDAALRGSDAVAHNPKSAGLVTPPPVGTAGGDWFLVVRQREINEPEVWEFRAKRPEDAAANELAAKRHFDAVQANWTETFFCRVVYGPGRPMRENLPPEIAKV